MSKAVWHAQGLRWIGSLFNRAADHLERAALVAATLDPRVQRARDEYLSDVRHRAHVHF